MRLEKRRRLRQALRENVPALEPAARNVGQEFLDAISELYPGEAADCAVFVALLLEVERRREELLSRLAMDGGRS